MDLKKSSYLGCLALGVTALLLCLFNKSPDPVIPPVGFRALIIGSGGIKDDPGYTFTVVSTEFPDGTFERGLQNYAFQRDSVDVGAVRGKTLTAISHLVSGTTYTRKHILRRWNIMHGRKWSKASELILGSIAPDDRIGGISCSPDLRWVAFSTTTKQAVQRVFILDWLTKQTRQLAELQARAPLRLACTNKGDVYVREHHYRKHQGAPISPVTLYCSNGPIRNIGSYHQVLTTKIGSFGIIFHRRLGEMTFTATPLDNPLLQKQRYRVRSQHAMLWEDVICSDDGKLWGIVLYKPERGWPFYALERTMLVMWSHGQEEPICVIPLLEQEVEGFSLLGIQHLGK
jgi:hypothetical protein